VSVGYCIHRTDRIRLLLLRSENLRAQLNSAMRAFLGLPSLAPRSANTGGEKPYGPVYRRFLAEAVLPPDYLNWMYESRLARHFYHRTEVQCFRDFWSRTDGRYPPDPAPPVPTRDSAEPIGGRA
jgi:hypothetical protein